MAHRTFLWRAAYSIALLWLATASAPFLAGEKATTTQPKLSIEEAQKTAVARLERIAFAFHAYHEVNKELPPAALIRKDGKSLLSWRVLLLPQLGQEKLFREFELTKPWDSPHNLKLLDKMPDVYRPVHADTVAPNQTLWQVFTGPETIFEPNKSYRLQQIDRGTANTILIVEAARPILWTRPEDLPYDAKTPLPKLGLMFPGIFLFAGADGAVRFGKRNFDEASMRMSIGRRDGRPYLFEGILADTQPRR